MNSTTTLDICNLALSKLGESPIPAIDPNGSPAARQCHLHYHPARQEVLCSHRWSFAQQLVTLSSSETTEQQENHDQHIPHHLPPDCLRVLSVNQSSWILRGRSIYTRESPIKLLYLSDCEDASLFEPLFIDALATRLAYKMCTALTSSSTMKQSLAEEYTRIAMPNATHFNAVQSHSNDTHPLYQLWKDSGAGGGRI